MIQGSGGDQPRRHAESAAINSPLGCQKWRCAARELSMTCGVKLLTVQYVDEVAYVIPTHKPNMPVLHMYGSK